VCDGIWIVAKSKSDRMLLSEELILISNSLRKSIEVIDLSFHSIMNEFRATSQLHDSSFTRSKASSMMRALYPTDSDIILNICEYCALSAPLNWA
jgi:hypothetical protein